MPQTKRKLQLATLLGLLAITTQCATVFSSKKYNISITTNPPGADVTLKVNYRYKAGKTRTPGLLEIDWSDIPPFEDNLFIEVSLKGYKTENLKFNKEINPIIYLNLFNAGWGAIVDLITGAAWRPLKTTYNFELARASSKKQSNTKKASAPKVHTPRKRAKKTVRDGRYSETVILKNGKVIRNVRTEFRVNHIIIHRSSGTKFKLPKSAIRTIRK